MPNAVLVASSGVSHITRTEKRGTSYLGCGYLILPAAVAENAIISEAWLGAKELKLDRWQIGYGCVALHAAAA